MALEATGEIEAVNGPYQRLYVPARLSSDSQYPFDAGDDVRLAVIETTCERRVLVICPGPLAVDAEVTDLVIEQSGGTVDIEEVATHD